MAVLCYLFDEQGRLLLLHRNRAPNLELFSPVGGKLHKDDGESPTQCAQREIREETGLDLPLTRLHLTGIITEAGFDDAMHWMMFLYEVTGPVAVDAGPIDEGTLEWHDPAAVNDLAIPQTDRRVIWPLFQRYRGRFFCAHLQCAGGQVRWRMEQPVSDITDWSDEPASMG